ncbi:tryptophan synthase subunit alpha [Sphingomicrobium astaxanthinifaciens]|uniref:tryptophan synthase subunit alpha n=1 Tax=Sphingomicrobium astaxanthinifaciens TaxID=1227949 RepID=UPI001FCC4CD7|nr:tryptophan synthase subunit alpha [Sphingomicrobium astaxanthinifaciens]MCJ7421198.1 tryptophan synthase subunit alpha [Sphingomicrobium astaxanthinifaciens]
MRHQRYGRMFARLDAAGEGALGAFLMLGDPDAETSFALLDAAVAGGADMLEVGIAFSDPVADGPVIQAAAQRALAGGITPRASFELIARLRERHAEVPIGILTYANLVVARGLEDFCAAAARAGADSLLVADVPSLEAARFADAAREAGLDPVLIAAPNTGAAALERIAALGSGYIYCVARAGVTGQRADMALDHDALFDRLRALGAPPPVLGFGISTPAQVRAGLAAGAAGVICGSAIVAAAQAASDPAAAVREFVATLKAATRG